MSSCDNTVLTGQEGLIQFKPLGTTNCVDDYCPFVGNRIYLPCSADYDVDDCIEIWNASRSLLGKVFLMTAVLLSLQTATPIYVVNDGKGAAGDVDATAVTTWRACPTSKLLQPRRHKLSAGTPTLAEIESGCLGVLTG